MWWSLVIKVVRMSIMKVWCGVVWYGVRWCGGTCGVTFLSGMRQRGWRLREPFVQSKDVVENEMTDDGGEG